MAFGIIRRIDPDHRAGSPTALGGSGANTHAQRGTPIPGGIGGARFDGAGLVLSEPGVNEAARQRMLGQLADARPGIPAALPSGDLPPGLHQAQWGELTTRYAHASPRRGDLTGQLGRALNLMHGHGTEQAMIGGSYVGSKLEPGDVDIAVIPRHGEAAVRNIGQLQAEIAKVAPDVHIYDGARVVSNAPQLGSGPPGESFVEFFQHDRSGARRGALLVQPQPSSMIDDAARAATRLLR